MFDHFSLESAVSFVKVSLFQPPPILLQSYLHCISRRKKTAIRNEFRGWKTKKHKRPHKSASPSFIHPGFSPTAAHIYPRMDPTNPVKGKCLGGSHPNPSDNLCEQPTVFTKQKPRNAKRINEAERHRNTDLKRSSRKPLQKKTLMGNPQGMSWRVVDQEWMKIWRLKPPPFFTVQPKGSCFWMILWYSDLADWKPCCYRDDRLRA